MIFSKSKEERSKSSEQHYTGSQKKKDLDRVSNTI